MKVILPESKLLYIKNSLLKEGNSLVDRDTYTVGAEGDGGNNEYFHIEENQEQEVNADEIKLDSFKAEDHLAPKIWKGMTLSSKVRLKLLDIADDFWDTCNLDWVKLRGIHLTVPFAILIGQSSQILIYI